jgi:hypothetical protein
MHGAEHGAETQESPVFLDLVALWRDIRRRWSWLLLGAVAGLTAALLYLNAAETRYTTSLRVTPATSAQGGLPGTLSRLGGLASLAGVSVRQGAEGATPFDLYLDRLTSRELAEALSQDERIMQTAFNREWNPTTRSFVERPGLLRPLRNMLFRLSGQEPPAWTPPGAERLQIYLRKTLRIAEPGPKGPAITVLSVATGDPDYGAHLLNALHRQADADVRATSLDRARQYAAHLSAKLAATELAEHRRTLSEALLEQERAVMMATSSAPYAALPLEPASGPSRPTSPSLIPSLAVGLAVGTIIGLLAIAIGHLASFRAEARPNT